MIRNVSVTNELNKWKKNFQQNQRRRGITESSVVGLELLEDFLKQAKKECPGYNGLRIYFIRYDTKVDNLKKGLPNIIQLDNAKFSQVSLAVVPVKNFDPITLDGEDFTMGDKILTLAFCHPNFDKPGDAIGTGHCPPVCNPKR